MGRDSWYPVGTEAPGQPIGLGGPFRRDAGDCLHPFFTMARFARLLLIGVLLWSLLPGLGEVVENSIHFLRHGHLAHDPASPGESHAPVDPEHGCGATFRLCSCCCAQPSEQPAREQSPSTGPLVESLPPSEVPQPSQGVIRRLDRPPRA